MSTAHFPALPAVERQGGGTVCPSRWQQIPPDFSRRRRHGNGVDNQACRSRRRAVTHKLI